MIICNKKKQLKFKLKLQTDMYSGEKSDWFTLNMRVAEYSFTHGCA